MNNKHNIHCPICNELLDKREMTDGETIEKYCPKCKINWVFVVSVTLKAYKEYEKENTKTNTTE